MNIDGSDRRRLNDDKSLGICAAEDHIYYAGWSDDIYNTKIYSIKTDGSERRLLSEDSTTDILYEKSRIYYINHSDNGTIYSMNTDGSDRRRLNDDYSYFLNVVDNMIYYLSGVDDAVYSMKTDGINRQKLNYDLTNTIKLAGNRIYLTLCIPREEKGMLDDGTIYSMTTDGSDKRCLDGDSIMDRAPLQNQPDSIPPPAPVAAPPDKITSTQNPAPTYEASSQQGLSVSQIQNREGIYIKRGDSFYRLELPGDMYKPYINELNYNLLIGGFYYQPLSRIVCSNSTNEHLSLYPSDQVVYVGSIPNVYGMESRGYMVGESAVMKRESSVDFSTIDGVPDVYTHINGVELKEDPKSRNFIALPSNNEFVFRHILVGDKGQEFTLGKWEGTNWVEKKVNADTEYFSINKVDITFEATYDGYFILNFDRSSWDYFYFDVVTNSSTHFYRPFGIVKKSAS